MSSKEIKIHIRRCHICHTVNEQKDSLVDKCTGCGKTLAPFMFFDEKAELGLTEVDSNEAHETRMRLKSGNWGESLSSRYPPIWGLAVYW
ncbi:MAG: hypothetical protein WA160_06120 [Pseudobdellovibrio sp.]